MEVSDKDAISEDLVEQPTAFRVLKSLQRLGQLDEHIVGRTEYSGGLLFGCDTGKIEKHRHCGVLKNSANSSILQHLTWAFGHE